MLTLSQALSIRVTIVGVNEVLVFIKHPFWCDEISHKQTIKCISGKPAKMYTERKLNWTVVTEELGDCFSTGHWGKAFLGTLYLLKLQEQEWHPCPWSCCASKYPAFLFVYSVNLCCLELYRIYTGFVFYIKAIILKNEENHQEKWLDVVGLSSKDASCSSANFSGTHSFPVECSPACLLVKIPQPLSSHGCQGTWWTDTRNLEIIFRGLQWQRERLR